MSKADWDLVVSGFKDMAKKQNQPLKHLLRLYGFHGTYEEYVARAGSPEGVKITNPAVDAALKGIYRTIRPSTAAKVHVMNRATYAYWAGLWFTPNPYYASSAHTVETKTRDLMDIMDASQMAPMYVDGFKLKQLPNPGFGKDTSVNAAPDTEGRRGLVLVDESLTSVTSVHRMVKGLASSKSGLFIPVPRGGADVVRSIQENARDTRTHIVIFVNLMAMTDLVTDVLEGVHWHVILIDYGLGGQADE